MSDTPEKPIKTAAAAATPAPKAVPPRKRGIISRLFFTVILLVVIGLFVWAEIQRREQAEELNITKQELEEVKETSQQSAAQVGQEVLAKVKTHIDIPEEDNPTVATIVNVEQLRKENPFYEKANNGDHLIVTKKRAILYSAEKDMIIDVVPIVVNETPSGTPAPTTSPKN